jgi:hypothetical protein
LQLLFADIAALASRLFFAKGNLGCVKGGAPFLAVRDRLLLLLLLCELDVRCEFVAHKEKNSVVPI